MAVEGKLDLLRLPEVLQVISQQRKTGILTVQGDEDIIAVSFFQGRVVAADALNEGAAEGLGAVLVEQGRIEAGALHRLASRADAEGRRFADVLVEEGHVARPDLLEALRVQTARLLLSLLDWDRGDFKFYGGDEVSYEEGFRSIGVDELLLHALEENEPTRARSVPSLDARLRRLESDRPIVLRHARTLSGTSNPPEDGQTVWVTPDEQRVLEAVSAERTVAEVADEAGVTDERARYVLYRFVREGLVAPLGAAPGAAAPARKPPTFEAPEATAGATRPVAQRSERAVGASREVADRERAFDAPATSEEVAVERPIATPRARPLAIVAATLATLLLVAVTSAVPVAFFLPFPWLESERAAMHARRDAAHRLELDLAAKTFFLLEGRFPDDLEELVAADLLQRADLFDSRGRRLTYEPRERSYTVRPLVGGRDRATFEEGIAGNFLLDPEILGRREEAAREPPLVLLD